MPKRKARELTTDEAMRRLFPKAVREQLRKKAHEHDQDYGPDYRRKRRKKS